METINQRILRIIEHFCDGNKAEFARKVGEKPQTISSWMVRNVGRSITDKILINFPEVSNVWLLTGEGEMLNDACTTKVITTEEAYREATQQGMSLIPEVNFRFSAGQTQLICGTEEITRYWFLPDCKDCEGVIQMVGRSMSPTLPSGCWLALKRYSIPQNDPNAIPFGNIFGVVVEDSVTGEYHGHIKILRRHKDPELAKRCWIAHSINTEEFDDFNIPIAQVRSLWLVKQHIVSDII